MTIFVIAVSVPVSTMQSHIIAEMAKSLRRETDLQYVSILCFPSEIFPGSALIYIYLGSTKYNINQIMKSVLLFFIYAADLISK